VIRLGCGAGGLIQLKKSSTAAASPTANSARGCSELDLPTLCCLPQLGQMSAPISISLPH
jgi:hypothetical protein